jgi:hypothetical protein
MLLYRLEGAPNHPVDPDVAVGLGNQLHVVVSHQIQSPAGTDNWRRDIYYLHGLADSRGVEPRVLPIGGIATSPVPTMQLENTTMPIATPLVGVDKGAIVAEPLPEEGDLPMGILVGVVPALVLLGVVLAIHLLRRG